MKITGVETHLLTCPWKGDPSWGEPLLSTAIIRVTTDAAGIDGLGEATIGYFAPGVVGPLVEFYKPILIGKDPMDLNRLTREMYDQSVWWARGGDGRSVLGAIEMALWDIRGKALKLPVYQLLGGAMRERIPVYASAGPSFWPIEENVKKVAYYVKQGYRAAKLSTHFYEQTRDPGKPSARLTEVPTPYAKLIEAVASNFANLRRAFGGDVELAIDGHQGGTPEPIPVSEAIEMAEALAPYRLRFFEEPLAYNDVDGYIELRSRSRIPIAGGESLSGLDQFHALFSRGGLHVAQPDVGWVGGISETMRIIHHAEAYNISTAIHTGAAMGPCLAASWHIAAATNSVGWLEQVVAAQPIQEQLLLDTPKPRDGFFALPTAPGLGVRFTPELLDKFRFIPGTGERT